MKAINVGDKVAYSANWLRSVGAYSGDLPHARGVVTEVKDLGGLRLARIDWGNPEIPGRVNVNNLCRVGGAGFATV